MQAIAVFFEFEVGQNNNVLITQLHNYYTTLLLNYENWGALKSEISVATRIALNMLEHLKRKPLI